MSCFHCACFECALNFVVVVVHSLVFEYNPPSKVYGYASHALVADGGNVSVTRSNVNEYVAAMCRYIMRDGVERQLKAFKDGFDSVFSMDSLRCFDHDELRLVMCGDQAPKWTRDEIMSFTEPKLGYTKERLNISLFCFSLSLSTFINTKLTIDHALCIIVRVFYALST